MTDTTAGATAAADATQGQAPAATAAATAAPTLTATDDRTQRELAEARKEAAGYRVKLRETEEAARVERERAAQLAADRDALAAKAAKADAAEAALKARLDAGLAKLPESARAKFASLDPATAFALLDEFQALAAGKPAAPAPASAHPAPHAPAVDLSTMSPADIRRQDPKALKAFVASARGTTRNPESF